MLTSLCCTWRDGDTVLTSGTAPKKKKKHSCQRRAHGSRWQTVIQLNLTQLTVCNNNWSAVVAHFIMWLHAMQCMAWLWAKCPSVCLSIYNVCSISSCTFGQLTQVAVARSLCNSRATCTFTYSYPINSANFFTLITLHLQCSCVYLSISAHILCSHVNIHGSYSEECVRNTAVTVECNHQWLHVMQ